MIEDALGGRIERADRAHAVDRQQPVEGIVDDAPHERVLVAQRQALGQQPDALVLDAASEADAIGQQRGDDPGRSIHDHRQLRLRHDSRRLQAEDDRQRTGESHTPGPDAEARSRHEDDQQRDQRGQQLGRTLEVAPLQQRVGRQGLDEDARQRPQDRHRLAVAQFRRAGANEDVIAAHDGWIEVAIQNVLERELRDRVLADPVVNMEGVEPLALRAGQHDRQPDDVADVLLPLIDDRHLPHDAIGVHRDVQRRQARARAELRQRLRIDEVNVAGLMDQIDVAGLPALLEHGQDHARAIAAQGLGQARILRRHQFGTEVDIEGDVLGAGGEQPVEQVRIEGPRPRPHADLVEARGIDLDHDQAVGRLALRQTEPHVRELVVDEIERADGVQQRDRREDRGALDDECDVGLHARHRTISRGPAGTARPAARRAAALHRAGFADSCVMVDVKFVMRLVARPAAFAWAGATNIDPVP